jgi:hypothetical protein
MGVVLNETRPAPPLFNEFYEYNAVESCPLQFVHSSTQTDIETEILSPKARQITRRDHFIQDSRNS